MRTKFLPNTSFRKFKYFRDLRVGDTVKIFAIPYNCFWFGKVSQIRAGLVTIEYYAMTNISKRFHREITTQKYGICGKLNALRFRGYILNR